MYLLKELDICLYQKASGMVNLEINIKEQSITSTVKIFF